MRILAIESSCDETAAAVVEDGRNVLSSVVASQVEEHKLYGGVVPEIASRRHAEAIVGVVQRGPGSSAPYARRGGCRGGDPCPRADRRPAGGGEFRQGAVYGGRPALDSGTPFAFPHRR